MSNHARRPRFGLQHELDLIHGFHPDHCLCGAPPGWWVIERSDGTATRMPSKAGIGVQRIAAATGLMPAAAEAAPPPGARRARIPEQRSGLPEELDGLVVRVVTVSEDFAAISSQTKQETSEVGASKASVPTATLSKRGNGGCSTECA